jgi:ATP-dependent exoDNAse (exonuclease V) beta subunit
MEAKVVFIIGLTDGVGGFPYVWLDDAIFRVIKDVEYDRMMEEERRLFYVALTRARDDLYLVTELGNESRFIDEIPEEYLDADKMEFNSTITPLQICAVCGTEIKDVFKFCPTCGEPAEGKPGKTDSHVT